MENKELRAEINKLQDELKKAKSLLQESLSCLDRDFCWEESQNFEEKVKIFLNKNK